MQDEKDNMPVSSQKRKTNNSRIESVVTLSRKAGSKAQDKKTDSKSAVIK